MALDDVRVITEAENRLLGDSEGPGPDDGAHPHALVLGARRQEVVAVLDAWYGTDHAYFKVKVEDGAVFILRHDVERDRWSVDVWWGSGEAT